MKQNKLVTLDLEVLTPLPDVELQLMEPQFADTQAMATPYVVELTATTVTIHDHFFVLIKYIDKVACFHLEEAVCHVLHSYNRLISGFDKPICKIEMVACFTLQGGASSYHFHSKLSKLCARQIGCQGTMPQGSKIQAHNSAKSV